MKTVRCAIYARKSSEEGLEQSFNSLDAQREACAAYILSQASEGWVALPQIYDDGGLSGGTLERPALQRLLAEVAAGQIDIIVVYKVDRLTRSLLDFSRLVEAFDRAGTSFVSVTQSFNTTTSMGRLTLNMLLSFAQFEREVTAERIRDKIAASKAKGMWMGGVPPLGYRPDGRSLAIVEEHAALVRQIFTQYLAVGNVRLLAEQLEAEGMHAPLRTTTTGKHIGGRPFTRGQLYLMLKCRTFLGEVQHRDQVFPGLHKPIIERALWDQAQAMLADNLQGARSGIRARSPALLAGLIRDADAQPLVSVHATKGKVRYRYYVSQALQEGTGSEGIRIPAREIEQAVITRTAQVLEDLPDLIIHMQITPGTMDYRALDAAATRLAARVRAADRPLIRDLLGSVQVQPDRILIRCNGNALAGHLAMPSDTDPVPEFDLIAPVHLTRSGRALRLVHDNGAAEVPQTDMALIKLIARAHRYWQILRTEPIDITRLAEREQVSDSWLTRVLRLAFLSPQVIDAIMKGRAVAGIDARTMLRTGAVSADWKEQGRVFLPAERKADCR